VSKYVWSTIHIAAAAFWMAMLFNMVFELVTTGNLSRAASAGGRYDSSFVVSIFLLFTVSLASTARAFFIMEKSS
jgi:hypothetical protein